MRSITYSFTGGATTTVAVADTATAAEQTAAIQAALDAVAGHAGALVTLSAGTFSISPGSRPQDGALRIGSLTELAGAGMGQTILKLADGSASVTGILRTNSGRTLADGSASTTHDVFVHDLTIDGNKGATTGSTDGFYCGPRPGTSAADTNITVDHVEICNVSRYGFDPHEQTIGLTISNSISHDNGVDGFTLDFCSDVLLINDTAYNNGRHGFNVVTSSSHVVFRGVTASNNGGTGITVQTGDNEIRAWTHDIVISDSHVDHNKLDGISIRQTNGALVTGVVADGNGGNGISFWGVTDGDAHGNTVTGVPAGYLAQKIAGYVQTFRDADPLNDRYLVSSNTYLDGVRSSPPDISNGAALWPWSIGTGADHLTGSDGADVIAAGSGDDVIAGGKGDDTLYGEDGNDTLIGGTGRDNLIGGMGDDTLVTADKLDTLNGGPGFDIADFSNMASATLVNLASTSQAAWTQGTSFTDHGGPFEQAGTLVLIEAVTGTRFDDTLIGDGRDNILDGGAGDDKLVGGAGNDTLIGGSGNDRLIGGAGNDIMTGGSGADVFFFETGWGSDTITDFTHGRDHLSFAGVGAITGISDLAITQSGGNAVISYGGQSVTLVGVDCTTLTHADFMFHA